MDAKPVDTDDGIVYISQTQLIALQKDARLLKQKAGTIHSRMSGDYVASFKGRGMEFDESRPYQAGDDIRNMDWRVTARTNKPHSKVFREERERPVLLWVDFRYPMFFGTRNCFKSVLAAKAAALLSWSASQQGDRLGGLIFSEKDHFELRPGRGKSAALHMIKTLSDFSHYQAQGIPQSELKSHNARHALNRLVQVTRPGSLIYMISDFRNVSDQLEFVINRLSRNNELVLIHVSDPLENDLPPEGFYRVTDGNIESEINSSAKKVRKKFHNRFTLHQQNLKAMCTKNGVRYIPLLTTQSPLSGLRQIPGLLNNKISSS